MNIGHNSRSLNINTLPASMQGIADTLGLGVVLALVDNFPGLELRVPHRLRDNHQLMALGQVQAEMLCAHYGGDTIHVPLTLDRSRLKRQVDDLQAKGLKRQEIAKELGITQRHVRRLANRDDPPDDRQFDLFSNMDD